MGERARHSGAQPNDARLVLGLEVCAAGALRRAFTGEERMTNQNHKTTEYLLASDFDQTLSFNDLSWSGVNAALRYQQLRDAPLSPIYWGEPGTTALLVRLRSPERIICGKISWAS